MEREKLQKVLARIGLASRREIERWIDARRVTVNARPASVGDRVGADDVIRVDGRLVDTSWRRQSPARVIRYHKPTGEICSRRDARDRPVVFAALPKLRRGRWVSIGRLDINTSGLLLLTDDGELAHRLMHPSYRLEREYAVRVRGPVSPASLARLARGVDLDDGVGQFSRIEYIGGQGQNHWYHVIIHEGRKREVRRLWESQGHIVSRLTRVRFGPIRLPRRLRRGAYDELSDVSVARLLDAVGLSGGVDAAASRSRPPRSTGSKPPSRRRPAAHRPRRP